MNADERIPSTSDCIISRRKLAGIGDFTDAAFGRTPNPHDVASGRDQPTALA